MSTQNAGSSARRVFNNGSRLILSVDDEPTILFTRQQILERAGYRVLSATNGEQALAIFAKHCVDLVLLDYVMPGLNGGIVAQEIKRRTQDLPIIMVSGSHRARETVTCVDCFVDKGEDPALLLEKVKQVLPPAQLLPQDSQRQ